MDIIQTISDFFSNLDILFYLKLIGVVLLGAVLFPIIFIIVLTLVGFTTSGIAGGSLAATWMASLGNVPAGSAFSMIQSISVVGIFLLCHPVMLVIEAIMGLATMLFIGYCYSFDVDALFDDFPHLWSMVMDVLKSLLAILVVIINGVLSMATGGFLGSLLGIVLQFGIAFVYRKIKKSDGPIALPGPNSELGTMDDLPLIVFLLPIVGFFIGACLGFIYPFHFFG